MKHRSAAGYSIVELMVALTIGLVLLLGVSAVFVSSRASYQVSEAQAHMLDDGRFVLQLLAEDVRMSGSWGPNSHTNLVVNRTGQAGALPTFGTDCAAGWYTDLDRRVFGSNETNTYVGTCIPAAANWRGGTDLLVVRYANPNRVTDANLSANVTYVQSNPTTGRLFAGGGAVPAVNPDNNFMLQSNLYYVSNFTEPGDNYPSLHRITLGPGPTLIDELIAPGVEDFQVQFGVDTCNPTCDGAVNSYVNADSPVINWASPASVENIRAVRVWVLLRSEFPEQGVDATRTFDLGGKVVTPGDSYRRMLVSNVFQIRNRPQ